MNLSVAEEGKEYIIQRIETDDEELDSFLFSLGCYSGEPVTVVSRRKGGCTVSIKDGRYNIGTLITAPASLNIVAALIGLAVVVAIGVVIAGMIKKTNKNMAAEYALRGK